MLTKIEPENKRVYLWERPDDTSELDNPLDRAYSYDTLIITPEPSSDRDARLSLRGYDRWLKKGTVVAPLFHPTRSYELVLKLKEAEVP
jgi:hypothetical protein